ncbi:hypothetical protein CBS101457_004703 [Exobasidium rhododendri]|nr:hypothetical protein CBS101457_004703 [Exobasidium rhododendri]
MALSTLLSSSQPPTYSAAAGDPSAAAAEAAADTNSNWWTKTQSILNHTFEVFVFIAVLVSYVFGSYADQLGSHCCAKA